MIKTPSSLPNLKTCTPTKASWNCLKEIKEEIDWLKKEEEEEEVNQGLSLMATLDLVTTTTVQVQAVVGDVVFFEEQMTTMDFA